MPEVVKKKCNRIVADVNPCGRDLYDDEHCIFHSKDIGGKKTLFNDVFWQEFKRQEMKMEQLNFKGFVFPGHISFCEREFKKKVSFEEAQFFGDVNFSYVQFSEDANFKETKFSGNANFENVKFSGRADFDVALFSGDANFMLTKFSGFASFWFSKFTGGVAFLSAQFFNTASFSNVQFFGDADFAFVQFSEDADFQEATFSKHTRFNSTKFESISKISMIETYFYDVSGFLEMLSKNKKFLRTPRRTKTEFLSNKIRIILGEKCMAKYPIISRQIRDDWYLIRFQEKHPKFYFLWWLFADCGRSILRWALWSLLFALSFAFIYHNIFYLPDPSTFNPNSIHKTWPGLSFMYYSVVTFTTLGFGDIVPKPGWLQFWVSLEVILGYIMLGGLISILANKFARRS